MEKNQGEKGERSHNRDTGMTSKSNNKLLLHKALVRLVPGLERRDVAAESVTLKQINKAFISTFKFDVYADKISQHESENRGKKTHTGKICALILLMCDIQMISGVTSLCQQLTYSFSEFCFSVICRNVAATSIYCQKVDDLLTQILVTSEYDTVIADRNSAVKR